MARAIAPASTGLMSTPILAASARNWASWWVATNASCSALVRSSGTPGGAANGRAIVKRGVSANAMRARAFSSGASSRAVGTSGSSGWRVVRANWRRTLKPLPGASQAGCVDLTAEESNVRPSISPRSTARKSEGESGYPSTWRMLRPSASRRIFGTSASRAPSPVPAEHDRRPACPAGGGDRRRRGVGTHDQHERIIGKVRRRAEPGELARVELGARIGADQPDQRNVAAEDAEGRAVLRRGAVEPVGGTQAAGAGHVLYRDRRVARDEPADVARDQPRREIVAAARPVADDQVDLPSLIECRDGVLGVRRTGERAGQRDSRETRKAACSEPALPLPAGERAG